MMVIWKSLIFLTEIFCLQQWLLSYLTMAILSHIQLIDTCVIIKGKEPSFCMDTMLIKGDVFLEMIWALERQYRYLFYSL